MSVDRVIDWRVVVGVRALNIKWKWEQEEEEEEAWD